MLAPVEHEQATRGGALRDAAAYPQQSIKPSRWRHIAALRGGSASRWLSRRAQLAPIGHIIMAQHARMLSLSTADALPLPIDER
jgi:hypothetical protein